MSKLFSTCTTAIVAGAFAFSGAALATEVDTFAIDVIVDDLSNIEDAEEFEMRLKRKARQYCEAEAPYASRSHLRACEDQVIDAVVAALEDDDIVVAWNLKR